MFIKITGRIPSKKNSKIMVCRGRFPMLLPSKTYSIWHKDASSQLSNIKEIKTFNKIILKIFAPDNRKSDLSNKSESLMDLLVDNKIIKDDNWFVCPDIQLLFGGVDKENPRCEISIL